MEPAKLAEEVEGQEKDLGVCWTQHQAPYSLVL